MGKTADEPVISLDIGTSSIKLLELDLSGGQPTLLAAASSPSPAGALSNNAVARPEEIAKVIQSMIEANEITATKVVTAVPGPSAFSKKVTLTKMDAKDLEENISFEAGNYIPHNINQVFLDYQVVNYPEGNSMDVLLVAVKNDVVNSYLESIEKSGLEPAILDVDYFALENMFEINYPEEREKTVALVNIGARYTAINIMASGMAVFSGDVGVGGRLYTDALCETLGMQPGEAEQTKMGVFSENFDENLITETLDRTTEHVSSELNRQLGFFWNAAATENPIDTIYLSGGGALVTGLLEELSAKTGIACKLVEPFRNINGLDGFDADYLEELSPSMAVSIGLASRRLGDKQHRYS